MILSFRGWGRQWRELFVFWFGFGFFVLLFPHSHPPDLAGIQEKGDCLDCLNPFRGCRLLLEFHLQSLLVMQSHLHVSHLSADGERILFIRTLNNLSQVSTATTLLRDGQVGHHSLRLLSTAVSVLERIQLFISTLCKSHRSFGQITYLDFLIRAIRKYLINVNVCFQYGSFLGDS